MNLIERARIYTSRLPAAVQNARGRLALFKAAKVVAFDFDLPESDALPILAEFNSRCLPPFSERELRAALTSAKKDSRGERGKLKKMRPPPASGYKASGQRPREALPPITGPTLRQILQAKDDADNLARKRTSWPVLRNPSDAEIQQIASLRSVSHRSVETLTARRLLMTCTYQGRECFAFSGRKTSFRQIRHMDGSPIIIHDRTEKAKALPGSRGHWIDEVGAMDGATVIPAGFPVIIVEGLPGILEAVEARMRADDISRRTVRAWIIARVSAGHPVTRPLLSSLDGRRVRIIADNDESGRKSASELHVRIKAAGGFPEIILPPGGKDLGDSLKALSADHPFWLQLFTF